MKFNVKFRDAVGYVGSNKEFLCLGNSYLEVRRRNEASRYASPWLWSLLRPTSVACTPTLDVADENRVYFAELQDSRQGKV